MNFKAAFVLLFMSAAIMLTTASPIEDDVTDIALNCETVRSTLVRRQLNRHARKKRALLLARLDAYRWSRKVPRCIKEPEKYCLNHCPENDIYQRSVLRRTNCARVCDYFPKYTQARCVKDDRIECPVGCLNWFKDFVHLGKDLEIDKETEASLYEDWCEIVLAERERSRKE